MTLDGYRSMSNDIEDAAQAFWLAAHDYLMAIARGDEPLVAVSEADDRFIYSSLHDALACMEGARARLDEMRRRYQGDRCPFCDDAAPCDAWESRDKQPCHLDCLISAQEHALETAADQAHYAKREE